MHANNNIKKVLVAPLDWGLGHATRCIPLIRALLSSGYEVVLAGEGAQANLLKTEFPSLVCLPLPGYRVSYSKNPALLAFALLQQLPDLLRIIRRENRWLQDTICEQDIDLVISDNRYGLFSSLVPCVFITHQLLIKAPFRWLEKLLQRINYHYIDRFSACWVPDAAGEENAGGALSHPDQMPGIPVHYLGLLSRFTAVKNKDASQDNTAFRYNYCILLSGPEPQRSLLENRILAALPQIPGKVLLVRGKPGNTELVSAPSHVEIKNHLPNAGLQEAILQSEYIVSRTGYTTVMELLSLNKKSILIPTPGQTEQEYLAELLRGKQYCYTTDQQNFSIPGDLTAAKAFDYRIVSLPVFDPSQLQELLLLLPQKQ